MSNRLIYEVILVQFCLFFACGLHARAPLLEGGNVSIKLEDESRLEWRIKSAELALNAGLPGLAETIYSSLLDSPHILSSDSIDVIEIGLAKSLICQRRYDRARIILESMSFENRGSQHALYLALSIYGNGIETIDESAFRLALAHASEKDLQKADRPWLALLQAPNSPLTD